MTTILAPHIGDETVGCYTRLVRGDVNHVVYFFEQTAKRKLEAHAAASRFCFEPHFVRPEALKKVHDIVGDRPVLIPAITDSHPARRYINQRFRTRFERAQIEFYSVDLGQSCRWPKTSLAELDNPAHFNCAMSQCKHNDLDKLYPSQVKLWENDHSYFLFESIVKEDFLCMSSYNVAGVNVISCVTKQQLLQHFTLWSLSLNAESVMNALFALHPGPHRVQAGSKLLTSV